MTTMTTHSARLVLREIVRVSLRAIAIGMLAALVGVVLLIVAAMLFEDVDHALARWLSDYRCLNGEYVDGSWEAEVPSQFGHDDTYAHGRLSFTVVSGCEAQTVMHGSLSDIRCGPDEEAPEVSFRTPDGSWSTPQGPWLRGSHDARSGEHAMRLEFFNPARPRFDAVRIRISGEPEIRSVSLAQSK